MCIRDSEAIATIIKELAAIRRLSRYLKETYPQIHSAEELNRELLEEYLTYLATEAEGVNKDVYKRQIYERGNCPSFLDNHIPALQVRSQR